ncbi:hypothetical protein [Candidatus Nitrosotalea sp. TS]|uniref:hypothetical protein n=1 Tax=Candidatus Nitrosotalea sp. TS TaxID=2341020 RepID=UPI0014089C8C|nr:hypothetical protein [Candidatus Nitrosotalea sp. TS]
MVNLGTAKLAGMMTVVGIVAIAGTNLAFAQQPSCGEQAYGYIGCTPLVAAQQYGAIMVAAVVACAIAFGAAWRQYHTIP